MKINRVIIIKLGGEYEGDIECAFEEAVRLIQKGNVEGTNENETGGFSFTVEDKCT